MAYTEKSLNTQHLDRPAVVLFKKPLATNDEMSFELEKLIEDAFPMEQHTSRSYGKNGQYKAVFYRPANPTKGAITKIGYRHNGVFTTSYCTDEPEQINTRFGEYDIEKNYAVLNALDDLPQKTLNIWIRRYNKWFFGYDVDKIKESKSKMVCRWFPCVTEEQYKTLKPSAKPILKELPTYLSDLHEAEQKNREQDKFLRTWYIFSLDDNYYVPDLKYNVEENLNTKKNIPHRDVEFNTGDATTDKSFTTSNNYSLQAQATATLNPNIVYLTESISLNQFKKEVNGRMYRAHSQLWDIINTHHIAGVYKVILQPKINYGILHCPSYEDVKDMHGKLMEQNKKYTSIFNTIGSIDSYFLNNYGFRQWELGQHVLKRKSAQPILDSNPNLASKYLDTNKYKIDVMSFLKNVPVTINGKNRTIKQDIIQSDIKPGFTGTYQLPSEYQTSVFYYADGNGSYMVFDKDNSLLDVIQAYISIASYWNKVENASNMDDDKKILQEYVNCEFPLRYTKQRTTSGANVIISTGNGTGLNRSEYETYQDDSSIIKKMGITPLQLDAKVQTQAFIESYGAGRIGNKTVIDITREFRQAGGYNVKLIDFKIMYYMMIKYNVVLPKYNKLEPEFIHGNNESSTVRMFPVNFFTATGSIEAGGDEVTFDDIAKLDLNSKKKLVDMYEQVYFGGWAGFYYTNATGYLEDVARYTNTSISDTVLTTVQEELITNDVSEKELSFIQEGIKQWGGLSSKFTLSRKLTELNSVKNTDVSSITVSRQTMGKSQATLTVKNTERKYNFKEGIFKGSCIFEPMDEVSIYLPTYSGGITMAFTGLISSVDTICSNGYNTLAIQCDCPLKMVEVNRTNIKPAAASTLGERSYTEHTVFEVPNDMLKSIENWSTWMLAQSLSYFTSMMGDIKNPESTMVYDNAELFKDGKFIIYYPKFNDPLLQYLWSRKSAHYRDTQKAQESLKELLNLYTDTIVYKHGEPVGACKETNGITNLSSVYTYNSKSNKNDYKKVEYKIYAQRSDSHISELGQRKCVAQITGTLQPAFALGTKAIPLLFSEYKTNMDILLETAEKFNFFLYSNRHGIVRFSPPMVSLTNLNLQDGILSSERRDKENDYLYDISTPFIIGNQNIITFRESQDDSKLVNYIQISGGLVESKDVEAANFGAGGTVANWPLIKKYGYHTSKKQAILGIANRPAIEAYALSLMDRYNKNFISAQCDLIGSGEFDINTTIYSAQNNTVYLLSGLNSQYEAGKTFTTSATLNWGRKPLCPFTNVPIQSFSVDGLVDHIVSTTLNPNVPSSPTVLTDAPGVKLPEFESTLNSLFEKNLITNAYYRQVKGILTALKNNSDYEQLLYSFIFNGYFWDGVPSISFEDLSTEFYSENIANGLEYPIFGSGKDDIANGAINLQKSVNNTKKSIKKNTTGVFLSLLDQSDPSKLQDTYVSD